jgi:hypothetical protein
MCSLGRKGSICTLLGSINDRHTAQRRKTLLARTHFAKAADGLCCWTSIVVQQDTRDCIARHDKACSASMAAVVLEVQAQMTAHQSYTLSAVMSRHVAIENTPHETLFKA